MDLFYDRLQEVRRAMIDNGLEPEFSISEINPEKIEGEDPISLVTLEKKNGKYTHTLRVFVYKDGEISAALLMTPKRVPQRLAFIGLITDETLATWTVRLSEKFAEYCSRVQLNVWVNIPERFDDEEGIFKQEDGPDALSALFKAFAQVPSE